VVPDGLDARLLVGREAAVLCLANLDYAIDPQAYRFAEKRDLAVTMTLPEWLRPTRAVRIDHEGPTAAGLAVDGDRCTVVIDRLLDATLIFVPNDPARAEGLPAEWDAAARE